MKEINTKRRILWLIVSCFCILVFISLVFAALTHPIPEETDEYADFVCLDPNLTYLKAGNAFAKYDWNSSPTRIFTYRKICDADKSDFLACNAKIGKIFPYPETFILQNPQSKINVISDWTISEIQFYFEPNEIENNHGERNIKKYGEKSISYSTTDDRYIEDIYEFINRKNKIPSEMYEQINTDLDMYPDKSTEIYIRLVFENNPYIVWDAKIFKIDEQYGLVVRYLDSSQTPPSLDHAHTSFYSFSDNFSDNLNSLVSNAINAIK